MYSKIYVISLFLFFVYVSQVFTQNSPMIFSVSPSIPEPYESVEITLKSGSEQVNQLALIKWFVDGKRVLTSELEKTITISMGDLGIGVTVSATIEMYNGTIYNIQKKILPMVFDVLLEGDVYTPPGYQGRNIITPQSPIHAVINILYIDEKNKRHTAKDFFFQWQFDDIPVSTDTFSGDSVLLPSLDYITDPGRIRILGNHKSKNIQIKKIMYVSIKDPKIELYENHPLYGITFNSTLPNKLQLLQKTNIVVIPYFFDKKDVENRNMLFKWKEDGKNIFSGNNAQYLQITPQNGKISANISVFVRNGTTKEKSKYLQYGNKSLHVSL